MNRREFISGCAALPLAGFIETSDKPQLIGNRRHTVIYAGAPKIGLTTQLDNIARQLLHFQQKVCLVFLLNQQEYYLWTVNNGRLVSINLNKYESSMVNGFRPDWLIIDDAHLIPKDHFQTWMLGLCSVGNQTKCIIGTRDKKYADLCTMYGLNVRYCWIRDQIKQPIYTAKETDLLCGESRKYC